MRKKFISPAMILFFLPSMETIKSQDSIQPDSTYPFIRYDLNFIHTPETDRTFCRFLAKYDSLLTFGKSKINIVHMGGSHIQAGIFTGYVRRQLQGINEYTTGSRGLIFPYSIAKSNNPYDYKVEYTGTWSFCRSAKENCGRLGLSGYSVSTTDSSFSIRFSFDTVQGIHSEYSRIKILHNDSAGNYSIAFDDSDAVVLSEKNIPEKSLTEIVLKSRKKDIHLSFARKTSDSLSFELYGLLVENEKNGITYHAAGTNGARVPSVLRCADLIAQLKLIEPDLVVLAYGTNDAHSKEFYPEWFEKNYDTLITRIREAFPSVAILLTTPNQSYVRRRYLNKNIVKAEQVMLSLAEKHGCSVWNFFEIMGGETSVPYWYKNKLMKPDKVHFTRKGYVLMGELFYSALLKSHRDFFNSTAGKGITTPFQKEEQKK